MTKILLPKHYPVTCHTDNVGPHSIFVAIKGNQQDGANYIDKAIKNGARKIVITNDTKLADATESLIKEFNVDLIDVENTRKALAELSAKMLDYPANSLKIIGITGTKGKTTTAYLLEHILKGTGYRTALLSSVVNRILDTEFKSELTTPQPDYLHVFLDICKQNKIDFVVMEVAAQALSLYRVYGIQFESIIFTNFSLEHSEFYPTLEDYFNSKIKIFEQLKSNGSIFINHDDPSFQKLYNLLDKSKIINPKIVNYGINSAAQIQGTVKDNNLYGLTAEINYFSEKILISMPGLIGSFSLYNVLAPIGFCATIRINLKDIKNYLLSFKSAPGRLEHYTLPNGALGIIDYAHNPSSFEAVLSALKVLNKTLIVVFGAGGDRDKLKRPLMGQIASRLAEKVILTTDNPRSEDPAKIIEDIKVGIPVQCLSKIYIELDREEAIKKAYSLSNSSSIIAILGKGPDRYQLINGVKSNFNESEILQSFSQS